MFDNEYFLINKTIYLLYKKTNTTLIVINLKNNKLCSFPIRCYYDYKINIDNPYILRSIFKRYCM